MRIAFVAETWLPHLDGVVTRLTHSIGDLVERGHHVLVVAPTVGSSSTGVVQHRTPGITLPFVGLGLRWGLPDPGLRRVLARFRPDVVHLVNPVGMGAVSAAQVGRRYPLVCSLHTDIDAYAAHYRLGSLRPLLRRLTSQAYRRADVVLATSVTGLGMVARLGRSDATVWPAGVADDLAAALGEPRGPAVRRRRAGGEPLDVICVGRLAPEKGYVLLLPLLRSQAGRGTLSLCFVGDGPDRARLQRRFAGTDVTFAGVVRDRALAERYRAADVLIFTSSTDTVGLVLLEAAAAGLPVVAVDSGTVRNTLAEYDGCVLISPDADPATWLAAVRTAAAMRPSVVPRPPATWEQATTTLLTSYRAAVTSWNLAVGSTKRPPLSQPG